jgi:hypothetical protein
MDADDKYEERLYDEFPRGAARGFGPDQGYNTWVRINDESLFTDEAKAHPAVREFLDAPFSVNFAQFKSSHREAEWFLHKPHRAMAEGGVEGILGGVADFPANPRIATLVINHELTLAKFITRAVVIEDGAQAGQMIHKQDDGSL